MKLLRSLHAIQQEQLQEELLSADSVGVTIGNFDGMHRGHQELFSTLFRQQCQRNLIVSFWPHPRRVIARREGQHDPVETVFSQLTSLRQRLTYAETLGFDYSYLIHFTPAFSKLDPRSFCQRFLVDALHTTNLVVGHDWSFGKDRSGSIERLSEFGREFGFAVEVVAPVLINGERVSSGRIRSELQAGKVKFAAELLGRPYQLCARVRSGAKRGGTIGIPTANLSLTDQVVPMRGVYACRAQLAGRAYNAVTNIGVRPTFDSGRESVEAHLIDYPGEPFYGELLSVDFVARLRDEQRFSGVEDLVAQIHRDIARARALLAEQAPH